MSELECRNLTLGYDSKIVISNLNFKVESGNYLCIIGENGSGKSTLMKTILGLRPAISGEIIFGDGMKKNEIGYLPQQTVVQKDFPASVQEIVNSGCNGKSGLSPFYSKKENATAVKYMEIMIILPLSGRCYRELSGGQQQRVLLARALCATDRMLLLDEPVAGLDPKVTVEMYNLIKELNSNGTTIIMISHDIVSALKYATHILHIGNDVFFGTKEEYLASSDSLILAGGEQNG